MSDQNDVKSEESDTFSKKMVDYKGSSIANSQDSVLAAGCTKQVAKQKSRDGMLTDVLWRNAWRIVQNFCDEMLCRPKRSKHFLS